jgi:hypothetical protein
MKAGLAASGREIAKIMAPCGKRLQYERLEHMKKLIGLAIVTLGLALSANAQSGRAGGVAGPTNGGGNGGAGGGSVGGGGMGGGSFSTLPSRPPASFATTAISGTDAEFVPSTFLPFESAVAAGQAVLAAQHASVAQVAAANSRAPKAKAKFALIEDASGNAVIATPR